MSASDDRLAFLEATLTRLARELAEARRELAGLRAGSPAPPYRTPEAAPGPTAWGNESPGAPAVHRESAAGARTDVRLTSRRRGAEGGVERLIGRYAAPAVAAVTILMGSGALVSWAVRRGMIGPWTRVIAGLLLSVMLAATGLRLRGRGLRTFGSILLALALAVLHVVAWGAGPYLHLVPTVVALIVADAGAIAIAVLGVTGEDELPFAVALGGAALAPFVMSSDSGQYVMLAAYGVVVLAGSMRVIGDRDWRAARWIALFAAVIYAAALRGHTVGPHWVGRELPAMFALALAAAAGVSTVAPARPRLALVALTLLATVGGAWTALGVTTSDLISRAPDVLGVAAVGSVATYVAGRELVDARSTATWRLAIVAIPTLLLFSVLSTIRMPEGGVTGIVVAAWAAGYAIAAWREADSRRATLMVMSVLHLYLSAGLATARWPVALSPTLAVIAVGYAWIGGRIGQPAVTVPAFGGAALAFAHALFRIMEHGGFTTAPFLSTNSLEAAVATVAAGLVLSWGGLPEPLTVAGSTWPRRRLAAGSVTVLLFLWARLELSRTTSPDVATFLLIGYDGACGAAAIGAGRRQAMPALRHVGLALALFGALRAILVASDVLNIVLRVGSYLLIGAFLLFVARGYWQSPSGGSPEVDSRT